MKGFSPSRGHAGQKWLWGFFKRHQIRIKKAKQISRQWVKALRKNKIKKWFERYVKLVKEKNITDPQCIWNIDESNLVNIPKEESFVGPEGKNLLQVIGKERAKTSTMITCINTAGESMKPVIIHHGNRVQESWYNGAPEGIIMKASTKGYINDKIFYEWGKLFLEHLKSLGLDDGNNILTFDGHGSHIYNLPLINDL